MSNPLFALAINYVIDASGPAENSAIVDAALWIDNILLGSIATILAVIAVALLGFAMLAGRINIRRALLVMLGCFVIFGARGIADGLRSFGTDPPFPIVSADTEPPAYPNISVSHENTSNAFDPYAGVSVKRTDE